MTRATPRLGAELPVLVAVGMLVTLVLAWVVYPALNLPSPAPYPLRTVALVGVVWWLMRRSGETWADFGVARPPSLPRTAGLVAVLFAAKLLVVQPTADALRDATGMAPSDLGFFDHLVGNELALAIWIVLAWTAAGFGEEFLFRGYLMKRLADMGGGTRAAWAAALLGQSIAFGLGHLYQGPAGALSSGFTALTFGAFFLLSGRNLWPVILVHAIWDTLGLIALYAGLA